MRASRRIGLGLAAGLLCGVAALGQGTTGARVPKTLPFTMSQTRVTVVRTLMDSQGRRRMERIGGGGTESARRDGDKTYLRRRQDTVQVTVFDPVAGINMNWTENAPGQNKMVMLSHIHRNNNPMPVNAAARQPPAPAPDGPEAVSTREDLGVKSLMGAYAHGWRTEISYPAGFDGNSAAYKTTSEYWNSVDLGGLTLASSSNTPWNRSATTLDSYTPGEPPASLFQAPEGYTVWDQEAGGGAIGGN